jgi:hypothetical protein
MKVVSNTSPITNLAAIQQLNLLQLIYDTIMIPQAVYNELTMLENPVPGTTEVQTLAWIKTYKVGNKILVAQLESEVPRLCHCFFHFVVFRFQIPIQISHCNIGDFLPVGCSQGSISVMGRSRLFVSQL